MVYIKFPQHLRDWIAEERGGLSPAKFLYNIIEQHYHHTISYKEKEVESRGHRTGAKPVLQGILPTVRSKQGD